MGKLEKISAWNLTKVRSKKEVIDEARTSGAKLHFASLMDICHLKNSELEAKHQKYKGRVVLRGDIVKDDSGSYAVFTEQGSSASQMTAAKVMDIISRLPGCDGQAADAVSAYIQVKMEDAPSFLKIPKPKSPDIWIRPPRHTGPKSWSSIEDPVVPLERNLYGHRLAVLRERQFEKISLKHGWEKASNWECLFVHRQKGLFLSVFVDDIKLSGKKQNIDPMWKLLNKEVDVGEPTSFLDHIYLGCTQRQCEISKDIVDNCRAMFELRIGHGGRLGCFTAATSLLDTLQRCVFGTFSTDPPRDDLVQDIATNLVRYGNGKLQRRPRGSDPAPSSLNTLSPSTTGRHVRCSTLTTLEDGPRGPSRGVLLARFCVTRRLGK